MPFDQFNVRLGAALARRVRVRAAETGVRPRDVLTEALVGHFGWPASEPEPLDGQLTVDEAQTEPPVTAGPGKSASRRPRAAEQAKRSKPQAKQSSETVNASGTRPGGQGAGRRNRAALSPAVDRSVETGEASPAGCPECGADVTEGKCTDCGWLA